MFKEYKDAVATQLSELSGVDKQVILGAIEAPKVADHGDLAVAIPRLRIKGNPVQLAKEYAEKVKTGELITGSQAIGPFLNFSINKEKLKQAVLREVFQKREKYGENQNSAGKKVLVEFSSPNIAKPFHAGHLRSTIIGNFVANLHKANGWDTTTINYLGDWGKQYGLLAVGYTKYGNESDLERDPIQHLFDVYVKINNDATEDPTIHDQAREYFRKMEEGDEEALALWSRFRTLSIEKYKQTYDKLNIHFDVYSGESTVKEGIEVVQKRMEEKELLKDSNGAKIVDLEKFKLGVAVVRKKDGTTLYLTRDLGASYERYQTYHFDKSFYIVSSQQDQYLKQLFKIVDLMGFEYAGKMEHVNYGLVKGMSTRKGTVVFLSDILDQTTEAVHDLMKQNQSKYEQIDDPQYVAESVAVSAIVIQDLYARRIKDYTFDWSRMLSFEGDTGPYLQYAHARLCSVERKVADSVPLTSEIDYSLLSEPEAFTIIDLIAKYPDLVSSSMSTLEPCNFVQYALKLSHAVSAAWDSLWVVNQAPDVAAARLLLYVCARYTLGNTLRLLGLRPLERM